jgi:alpha-beta hydrolase superfamily lysophospholipase
VETDLLGAPYEVRQLRFDPDDEGEVVATLVRLLSGAPTNRAVLYVHGFVDYFFQTHLAEFFTTRGYDFYALDLRKYGRSLLAHQTPNYCGDIFEYFAEIDEAVRIIREEDGHDTLVVNGHSTGGLTVALWAHRVRGRGLLQGLFLNSPFFEFNTPWFTRKVVGPVIRRIGRNRPMAKLPQKLGSTYGLSIHRDYNGEWTYDLAWKPLDGFPVYAGWVRAIGIAHRTVRSGLDIDVPVLVAFSTRSYRGRFAEAAHHADSVLNVNDIARFAVGLGKDVTLLRIEGGKHDLTLSPPAAREQLFTELDGWLRRTTGVDLPGEASAGAGAPVVTEPT